MGLPTGKIIARPMVKRACGCECEFQHFEKDRFRDQRLAQFQKTRCPACVQKHNEEQAKVAAQLPKKGEAFALLPTGATFTLTRQADGDWAGTLEGGGQKVEGTDATAQGLTVTLARQWVAENRAKGGTAPPA